MFRSSHTAQVAIAITALVQGGHRLRPHQGQRVDEGGPRQDRLPPKRIRQALQGERVEVDRLGRIPRRRRGFQQVEPKVRSFHVSPNWMTI